MAIRLARLLAIAALIGGVAYALGKIDWHALGSALRHARLELIAVVAALNFLLIFCKSERWRLMLRPVKRLPALTLFHYLIASCAASIVLPARAGEAMRVVVLKRRHGVPTTESIGILVGEKLFEVLGLLALVAPLPWLAVLPAWAKWSVALIAVVGIGGSAIAIALALRAESHAAQETAPSLIDRLAAGLRAASSPRTFFAALAWSIASYLIDAVDVWLVLIAVGVHVPLATAGVALLTLNLAISVPSTPGNVGALEAGAVAGLTAMGIPLAPALAFALVYHAVQVVPVLLAGLSGLSLLREKSV